MSPVFAVVHPGDPVASANLNQVINALNGTSGDGVAIALTALSDQTLYALTVENIDTVNQRALNVLNSSGVSMLRVDGAGVTIGSPLNLATGSVLTAAIADQGVTNNKLGPDVARANLLTNGGFEIWQRGNGPYTASGSFTADRWTTQLAGTDTLSVSQDTANTDTGGGADAACTFTLGTGAGATRLYQLLRLSDFTQLKSQTIAVSVRVRTATANAVRIGLNSDGTGGTNAYSSFHAGDGTYHTLTVTYAVPTDATQVIVSVWFAASCTAYVDNACLVLGGVAANYVPLHPADDLLRCLRYYELLGSPGGNGGSIGVEGIATAGGQEAAASLAFKSLKGGAPTITRVGTWTVSNTTAQPGANGFDTGYCRFAVSSTAAGSFYALNNAAGQYLTVEYNP